ncbi:zinc finger CCCH domain-containing 3-like, partial [Paramuricea clavata]
CKKKHVLECEEFSRTGECRNRSTCKLIHRKKVQQQRKRYFDEGSSLDEEDNAGVVKKSRRKSSDGFLPLEGSIVSDDEHLTQSHHADEETESNISIRIRPNFTTRENTDEEQ